jgi:hypothetical protein
MLSLNDLSVGIDSNFPGLCTSCVSCCPDGPGFQLTDVHVMVLESAPCGGAARAHLLVDGRRWMLVERSRLQGHTSKGH